MTPDWNVLLTQQLTGRYSENRIVIESPYEFSGCQLIFNNHWPNHEIDLALPVNIH